MRKMAWATGWSCVAAACCIGTATLSAAPLNLKQVSADAKAVGHLDFDAMRDSVFVQKAMAKHEDKMKKAEGPMKMCEIMIGMNPKKDLHGLTFYTKKIGKHEGVAILHAKADQKKIFAWAEKLPGRQASEHNGHKISTWTKEHHGKKHTVSAAWYGDEHLVAASSVEELSAALDVLDGKADAVGEDSALGGRIPTGTTVMLRATDIADAELKHKDPVAKQTKSFRFVLGEKDGESFYRSRSEMTNTEIVGQLQKVIEGILAAIHIHCGENEAGMKLVDALQIKPDGTTLTVSWKAPAEEVFVQVDAMSEKIKKHVAKMKAHHGKHGWGGHCPMCGKDGKCEKCDKCKKCEKCEHGKKKADKDGKKKSQDKAESDDDI